MDSDESRSANSRNSKSTGHRSKKLIHRIPNAKMNDDYSEQDSKEPLIKIKQVKLERDSHDKISRESFEKI